MDGQFTWQDADLPPGCGVEFISHGGVCKEAVLWFGPLAATPRWATLVRKGTGAGTGPGTGDAPFTLAGDSGDRLRAFQAAVSANQRLVADPRLVAYGRHVFDGGEPPPRATFGFAGRFPTGRGVKIESASGGFPAPRGTAVSQGGPPPATLPPPELNPLPALPAVPDGPTGAGWRVALDVARNPAVARWVLFDDRGGGRRRTSGAPPARNVLSRIGRNRRGDAGRAWPHRPGLPVPRTRQFAEFVALPLSLIHISEPTRPY